MAEAVYAIDAFPDAGLFRRIEWIGGVSYNASVSSDHLSMLAWHSCLEQREESAEYAITFLAKCFYPARRSPRSSRPPPGAKHNRSGKKRKRKNGSPETAFELRTEAYRLFGVDITQIPGVETIALPLFSELGRDMGTWPNRCHYRDPLKIALIFYTMLKHQREYDSTRYAAHDVKRQQRAEAGLQRQARRLATNSSQSLLTLCNLVP